MKIYKDNYSQVWYEEKGECLVSQPFGLYSVGLLNTMNWITNKELFIEKELSALSGSREKDIEDIFLYATSNRIAKELYDTKGIPTRESISNFYDKYYDDFAVSLWEEEFKTLIKYIKNLNTFKDKPNDIYTIYEFFKMLPSLTFRIELYEPHSSERAKKYQYQQDRFIKFIGHDIVENHPCEVYEIESIEDVFILDFWEFLFNPQIQGCKVKICETCGDLYLSSNGNAKYCRECKKTRTKRNYEKRMNDPIARIRKDILTYGYRNASFDTNEFINEAAYYFDLLSGKEISKNNKYLNITTKEEYKTWLESKLDEAKHKK